MLFTVPISGNIHTPSTITLVPGDRAPFGQHQTSRKVQLRKSAIHGLSVTLSMLRVMSNKSDWLRIRKDYSAQAQKIGLSQR